jgi:hypothetical protein
MEPTNDHADILSKIKSTNKPIAIIGINKTSPKNSIVDGFVISLGRKLIEDKPDIICFLGPFAQDQEISPEQLDYEASILYQFFSFFDSDNPLPDVFQIATGRLFQKSSKSFSELDFYFSDDFTKLIATVYPDFQTPFIIYEPINSINIPKQVNMFRAIDDIINNGERFVGIDSFQDDVINTAIFTIGEKKNDFPEIIVIDRNYSFDSPDHFNITIKQIVDQIVSFSQDKLKGIDHPYSFKTQDGRVFNRDLLDLSQIIELFPRVQIMVDYYNSSDIEFVLYQREYTEIQN